MRRRRSRFVRPLDVLYLTAPAELDGVMVGNRGRKAFEQTVLNRRHLPLKSIIPCFTRWSRVYVCVLGCDRKAHTVDLAGRNGGVVTRAMPFLHPGYQPHTPLAELDELITAIQQDYSVGTPTRVLAEAVRGMLTLWAHHRATGSTAIPLLQFDQVIGEELAPFIAARAEHQDARAEP